ncbi:hypothetical protein KAH81_02450 [bacterium]|nr:hypothetical protein [bacterium]
MRKTLFLLSFCAIIMLVVFGCEKSTDPEPEPEVFDPPTGMVYVTYQDSVKLTWNPSPDEGETGFTGYKIYHRVNADFSGLTSEEMETHYMGIIVNNTEIVISGLSSVSKHYFTARSIKIEGDDTTLSSNSNTVDTSPTIWFSDTLWESTGGDSAFSSVDFDAQVVYPMNLAYLTFIDLYLGVDDSNYLTLKSPSLFGTEWATREASVKRLGIATAGLSSFGSSGTIGTARSQTLTQPGTTFAIKIGSHYTKFYFVNFVGGAYPDRGIYFQAAYQEVEDYDHF